MADLETIGRSDRGTTAGEPGDADRRVRPSRGLPGGRAVVGGFLVAAAAVGIFAAHSAATAPPETAYAVATQDVPVGSVLTGGEFAFVPVDLPDPTTDRAVPRAAADQLPGLVTVAPLRAGDLLMDSAVVRRGAGTETEDVSVAVPRSRSLMDQLRVGERIDVVAAYGGSTTYVVRHVQVVAIDEAAGGIGEGARVYTLALATPEDVQAVVHAVVNAEVFLTRPAPTGGPPETPEPFRPNPPED